MDQFVLMDIETLDAVSILPLATGWWLMMACCILLVTLFARIWSRWLRRPKTWRADIKQQLKKLEQDRTAENAQVIASELSELLRRLALVVSEREFVAGVIGDDWLLWLQRHDESDFDWQGEGQLLVSLPYAPKDAVVDNEQLGRLLKAAWHLASRIKKCGDHV